jgi:hypothetical protein
MRPIDVTAQRTEAISSIVVAPYNKQLERTVIRRHVRAACAPFHYAHAPRSIHRRAAVQLRR